MATILIIDDEQTIHYLLANVVKRIGHQHLSAMNIKEGMDMLASEAVDVVILDVHLPDGRNHMAMVRLVTTLLNEWRKWRKCVPKSSELIRFFIREMDPHLLFRHVSACPLPGVRASLEP